MMIRSLPMSLNSSLLKQETKTVKEDLINGFTNITLCCSRARLPKLKQ